MYSIPNKEEDNKRRKGLALDLDTYKALESIFNSKYISEEIRLKMFTTYTQNIFLQNSKFWATTKALENNIDSFQRDFPEESFHSIDQQFYLTRICMTVKKQYNKVMSSSSKDYLRSDT